MARPRRLAESIRRRVPLPPGPFVVALSGGADSAVLAWLASQSSEGARAVFVDHQLAASGELRAAAGRVADFCELSLDIIEAPIDRGVPSFEEAARHARYQALMAAAKPEESILTGHTSDDQAETVLGNFLRGSGTTGLAGIPARRGRIHRPMLAVSRRETREAAVELGLPFFDDPDNESPARRRNRLRASLIPQLEADFNPALRAVLGRTAQVMAADDDALERLAQRIPVVADGEVVTVPAVALVAAEPAVASRAARRALRAMRGPHGGTHEEIGALLSVARGDQRGAELTGGLRVEREGPLLVISGAQPVPGSPVEISGDADAAFDRWTVSIKTVTEPPSPWPIGTRTLVADAGRVGPSLVLRTAFETDRVDIADGSKSVADALAERGVPRRLRGRWPVLTHAGRVAVIPGVRVAAWAAPGAETSRYLLVNMEVAD